MLSERLEVNVCIVMILFIKTKNSRKCELINSDRNQIISYPGDGRVKQLGVEGGAAKG